MRRAHDDLRSGTRRRRPLRLGVLALLLTLVGLVVPNSGFASTEAELIKVQHAQGVALDSDIIWILAVGSDARPGEDMTRSRGDALQLIGMHTVTGAVTSIGVPRDSYVPIDGYGSNRINASLYFGGPQLLAHTVGQLVGIEPDYVFVTRFKFFQALIDGVGGVDVQNPVAFDDTYLKPLGFEAGRIHLNGYGAMAFGRIRHNLPGGDFDRSANQQRVLAGIQAKVAERADEPGFLEKGVLSVLEHTATDVGPGELFRIAQVIAQAKHSKITGCVIKGSFATIGGASVVMPYLDQARAYGDDARDDAVISTCLG
ncbi:hypothetical protein BH11ACT8_BH11ACT8_21850 [soil metagenome]